MKKGKAYANRKPAEERPEGDFYATPASLVWELIQTGELDNQTTMCDPCAGQGAITTALRSAYPHKEIIASDLYTHYETTRNLYDIKDTFDCIVTNFPFSEWDAMVRASLNLADTVITIGRLNYFGTHARNTEGLWENLKKVYVFDRMVDYRTPFRTDGFFHVGALVTGWFVFGKDKQHNTEIEVIDVQKYAQLGAYTLKPNAILKNKL